MDSEVALTTIYPGEQIITGKFGAPGDQKVLTIPDGDVAISVTLSDTGRVAGFVAPGSDVSIFLTGAAAGTAQANPGSTNATGGDGTKLLLPKVEVIAVGATTVTSTTAAGSTGSTTTSSTLFTLAVDQDQAQKIIYASSHGTLDFALLTNKSKVKPGPATVDTNLFK